MEFWCTMRLWHTLGGIKDLSKLSSLYLWCWEKVMSLNCIIKKAMLIKGEVLNKWRMIVMGKEWNE